MIKTLVKRQLLALLYSRRARRNGKQKKPSIVLYTLLMLYVVGIFFSLFFSMMYALCAPLVKANMGWLYFALAGLMAILLAVIGSVFLTQSTLYEAKDNEFLLSLPIPPAKILLSRMISLYLQNFLFTSLVFLPAVIVYRMTVTSGASPLVLGILLLFFVPLVSLALACILAWLTALLTSHMRSKTLFTMILSLSFLGLYFYLYSRISHYMNLLIQNSKTIGANIRKSLYPFYQLGLAAEGKIPAFLLFAGMSLLLFAVIYCILSRSFIRITTTRHRVSKVKYHEKALRVSSVDRCLFHKELRRFGGSATYMLNCGLGAILMVIGAVFLLVKRDFVASFTKQLPGIPGLLPLLACLIVCFMTFPNAVTAPSISLEGNSLWILQSLPIDGKKILWAKLKLHLAVSAPAAFLCGIALDIVLTPSVPMAVLMLTVPCVFVLLNGELGLLFNLKMPKFDWVNESAAVKQSASVVVTIFVNMGILMAFAALYFLLPAFGISLSAEWFLLICAVIMAAVSALVWKSLAGWGAKRILFLQ